VLIKERGVQQDDFQWWKDRGFAVHTAGPTRNDRFFYNLRDIFSRYECVASPNMSSAVIFAVAMNRRAFPLPDVRINCVDSADLRDIWVLDDVGGRIGNVWRNLFSADTQTARAQAGDLLGIKYMADPKELKRRLLKAIEDTRDRPIHLYPLSHGPIYTMCIWLLGRRIPVQKLFPSPWAKVSERVLAFFRLNRLCVYYGADLSHYGVAGERVRFRIDRVFAFRLGKSATAGYAVREAPAGPKNTGVGA
jgi:hypothetical protein